MTDLEQREAELLAQIAALQEADRVKDEFLGIISHELRTPINGIMGYVSMVEDGVAGPLNELQRDYLSKALERADVLLSLVANLLDTSRIRAGTFGVETRPTDFGVVVLDVVASLTSQAAGRTLAFDVAADLPLVCADEQRLAQVLLNLIGNALKFTPIGGTVTVRVRREGNFAYCEVSDTGIGIASESLPQLFQAFSQVDPSLTRRRMGAGLGLSIAKNLVEAHGGSIGAMSQEAVGSTFWFTIPFD